MEILNEIELTVYTLLGYSMLPILYFGLQTKFLSRLDMLKRVDVLMAMVSGTLAVLLVLKVGLYGLDGELEQKIFALAHLLPAIATILFISRFRLIFSVGAAARKSRSAGPTKRQPATTESAANTGYDPLPLNSQIQRVSWDDLVIDDHLVEELQTMIELLKDPSTAHKYGIDVPKGILFQGPPGTGKTTIAKVVANTANLSFFVLRMDEVVSKWVGESEKNLSKLFQVAQKHAPAVIFVDEIDSIGKSRSGGGSSSWSDNLLNHFLQLLDGVIRTEGLYIIGATNRADLVDSALKRPGRLNKVIEIPLPHFEARVEIFRRHLSKLNLAGEIDLGFLAGNTDGYSGATIAAICNQAGLNAFQRETKAGNKRRDYVVTAQDIDTALEEFVFNQPPSALLTGTNNS